MTPSELEQKYLVAINEGLDTAEKIAKRIGVADVTARRKISPLIEKGWVTVRQSHYNKKEGGGRCAAVYKLTKEGAAIAKVSASPEVSIKDFCDGADYRQWMQEVRGIVKENERTVTKIRYLIPFFKIRQRGA